MRILFLSRWLPFPANNGSKIRIYNLLQALANHYDVTLLAFADQPDMPEDIPELQALCHGIQIVPWKPYESDSRKARLGFFSLTPRSLVDTFSTEMKQRIEKNLSSKQYDLVIASELSMASYTQSFHNTPTILEDLESSLYFEPFPRNSTFRSSVRTRLTWTKYHHYIRRILPNFEACTVVSEKERDILSLATPNYHNIEVIPNCIDLKEYHAFNNSAVQSDNLIFTGPFGYFANYDAMTWFINDVYPDVRKRFPDVNLIITGDNKQLPLPYMDNVTLTGFVDDVRPLIAQSCISIAPLRVGGGTRLKILEAMALRTSVVATKKGAEGLDVIPGRHLLIADTPKLFSESIIQLLVEPALREQLANNAYQLVKEKYDWARVLPKFMDLVDKVAGTQLKDPIPN